MPRLFNNINDPQLSYLPNSHDIPNRSMLCVGFFDLLCRYYERIKLSIDSLPWLSEHELNAIAINYLTFLGKTQDTGYEEILEIL